LTADFIQAPIICRASSAEDAGNFLNLPIPPAEDIPGFFQDDAIIAAQIRSDMLSYHFPDF
jgi:protein kinase A